MISLRSARVLFFVGVSVVLGLVSGCGGGTSGTGIDTRGRVLEAVSEQGVAEVRVTIAETGDSGMTDSLGQYNFKSSIPPGTSPTYLLEGVLGEQEFSNRGRLPAAVGPGTSEVVADWRVDPASEEAQIADFSISEEGGAANDDRPTPTPTPESIVDDDSDVRLRLSGTRVDMRNSPNGVDKVITIEFLVFSAREPTRLSFEIVRPDGVELGVSELGGFSRCPESNLQICQGRPRRFWSIGVPFFVGTVNPFGEYRVLRLRIENSRGEVYRDRDPSIRFLVRE